MNIGVTELKRRGALLRSQGYAIPTEAVRIVLENTIDIGVEQFDGLVADLAREISEVLEAESLPVAKVKAFPSKARPAVKTAYDMTTEILKT